VEFWSRDGLRSNIGATAAFDTVMALSEDCSFLVQALPNYSDSHD
jgi:hypothetical protein